MNTKTTQSTDLAVTAKSTPRVEGSQGDSLLLAPFILPAVKRVNKIMADLILANEFDITGSSGEFERGIRRMVEQILHSVAAKARSITVYQSTHGDEDCGQYPTVITHGGTVEQAIADANRLVFSGGGDAPEHHLTGIYAALKAVPWPADPRRGRGALMGYLTSDTKPDRDGMTPRRLGEKIREKGVLLYLVCEPYPFAEDLAEAAQGLIFPITNDPDPAQLQQISAQLSASILATVSAGGTRPMTVPLDG